MQKQGRWKTRQVNIWCVKDEVTPESRLNHLHTTEHFIVQDIL